MINLKYDKIRYDIDILLNLKDMIRYRHLVKFKRYNKMQTSC